MTDGYWRYYENHINCDWCGALTRGRVYKGRTDVSCGSCDRQLKELSKKLSIVLNITKVEAYQLLLREIGNAL